MGKTSIEWTEATWNPVVGCTKISPGCAHCYAETMAKRLKAMALADIASGKDPGRKRHYIEAIDEKGRWSGKLIPVPEALGEPLKWIQPRTVFVNSMSDLFHESVPFEFIDQVFAVMALARKHTFQVLTKRAARMKNYFSRRSWGDLIANMRALHQQPAGRAAEQVAAIRDFVSAYAMDDYFAGTRAGAVSGEVFPRPKPAALPQQWPLPNVWLGVSVENQQQADERIPHLLDVPAAVRFLSCEPLLGPIDFSLRTDGTGSALTEAGIDWVIVGGESGHGARPCKLDWVRSIVAQSCDARVQYFVKQLGSHVLAANDQVADWFDACPHLSQQPTASRQGEVGRVFGIRHSKGADPAEWPEDLQNARHFPKVAR